MGCTIWIETADCFGNRWKMCQGVYWSLNGARSDRYANVVMSRTGGNCPANGKTKRFYLNKPGTIDEFTVKVFHAASSNARIEVWRTSELEPEPEDPGFGFGRAEITQNSVGPGLIFNVNSHIDYSLRVMNTGDLGKIYGVIGLGYHDNDKIYFTGEYKNVEAEVPSGEQFTWNGSITVLHRDYAAREMTARGPGVYFMSGHEENGKIVWDRSEYIPIELILESGYVDPLDPEGVPEDWPEPVYDDSRPWDLPSLWDIVKPKPEDDPVDLMPFLYIGFMGLVGYMLIRNQ